MKPGPTVWMTAEQAAAHMQLTLRAFYRLYEKYNIPSGRIGRSLRFEQRVLDDYIRRAEWTLRRTA